MTNLTVKPEELINIDLLWFPDYNPNKQSSEEFNALIEQIKSTGITECAFVVDHQGNPHWKHPERYEVVSGNHRIKASKVIGYAEYPCRVKIWSEETNIEEWIKIQNMVHNSIKGEIDPQKFVKMYQEQVKRGSDPEKLMKSMRVDNNKKLRKALENSLPDNVKQVAKKLKTEDILNKDFLSTLIKELYQDYSDQVPYDFFMFNYGGKSHTVIIADDELKSTVKDLIKLCKKEKVSFLHLIKKVLQSVDEGTLDGLPRVLDAQDVFDRFPR